ncbi:MAG TPA: hypothetical protein VFY16_06660 [Gemmatimonadaceae bacterium]|nr:hypothetical protein [Gemmatimonadaceae bacterium]
MDDPSDGASAPGEPREQVRLLWRGPDFATAELEEWVVACMLALRADGLTPETALIQLKELLAFETGNSHEVAERRRLRERLVTAAIDAYFRPD